MTSPTRTPARHAPEDPEGDLSDKLFWLSKLDEDVPRAAVVPDFRRATTLERVYESIGFELDAEVVRILKSLETTRGASDVEICVGLLAVLLAKYQREDKMVVGLKAAAAADDLPVVVPLLLACERDATILTIMRNVAAELAEVSARSLAIVRELPQLLGRELGTHRFPLFDIALAVGGAGTTIDLRAYPVDLAFLFETVGGRFHGRVLYAVDLYEKATIERLVSHLLTAARQISGDPATTLRDIVMLTAEERRQVALEFNASSARFPVHSTFHALFEEQAARTPAATAVIHRDTRLSYSELNERANRLASTLLALGLTKGAFVGILLHRSCDFLVAMLAVFKAGGAYVPLDPTYPRDRIRYMLEDSEAALLISDAATVADYWEMLADCAGLKALLSVTGSIDGGPRSERPGLALVQPQQLAAAPRHNPELALNGTDRAYMIYTSGSSGRPKGAICCHDGALNHLFGELEGIGIKGDFRFLQTAASSSDISVWQFMAPLLFGGATVIADYEAVVDPALLLAAMREHQVTVAEPVPVVLRALIDLLAELPRESRRLPDLRCMMCTGEALPAELVDRWLALYPDIPIANTYGPTETSDDVTLLVMREPLSHKCGIAPIGRPLPNIRLFVLDRDLALLPVGVPGEICIAGIGVGEGYWRQPEKTMAAFVRCPFPEVAEGRMYRTGDLGRWLPDGSIEFLGRIDQQVKVRGYRVEPGEIEGVMTLHPAVQDAAVVTVEDAVGNLRLVGYFVTHNGAQLSTAELRQYLKGALADHMVPAVLVALDALPLTPLGKIDRRALTRIESAKGLESEHYVAPRNATEEAIAAVWSKIIGIDRVGIHDNFFEIGGDSILTIYAVAELALLGFTLAPRQIFRHPSVAELASHLLAGQDHADDSIHALDSAMRADQTWDTGLWREQLAALFPEVEDVYPLSATQRGIYFQSLLVPRTSGAYVEQIAFDLTGTVDETAFCRAWQHVAGQEEMLRTAVVRRGAPYPLQVLVRSAALVPSILDWREIPATQHASHLAQLIIDDRMKGFDLKRPPLSRVTLVRLTDVRWRVLWTYHHVIFDGWSEPLVLREVFQAYDSLVAGLQPGTEQRTRYRDFVVWSESQDASAAQRFWRHQLAGFTTPVSIKDLSPALTPPSSNEISHGWHEVRVAPGDFAPLEQVVRRSGLTLSTLIHGAWALLLHRYTDSADAIVGTIASGRQCGLHGIDTIRGLVVVTQPLRTRLVADATILSWLRLLQLQMAEMREYEHTPLALIQQCSQVPPERRPLFDSVVVVGNYAGSDLAGCAPAGLKLSDVAYVTQPLYPLTLFVTVSPELTISLVYDKRRYALETVRQIMSAYLKLLRRIAENPEQRVTSLLDIAAGKCVPSQEEA